MLKKQFFFICKMTEINEVYVRNFHKSLFPNKELNPRNIEPVIATMKKYGENRWWESKDPVTVARYQIFEDRLLVYFDLYHDGLTKLLGRAIMSHEFGLNADRLREEALEAIAILDAGGEIGTISERLKVERESKGIKGLYDFCERNGKRMIKVPVSKDKKK